MRFLLTCSLAVALLSANARADWPEWALADTQATHANEAGFQDGFAYTLWGAIRFGLSRWAVLPALADRTFEIAPDPEFDSPGLRVSVHLAKKSGQVIKAPLLILLPGVFGDVKDPVCTYQMELYSSLGYHVVAFPNPWSTEYRAAKPRSMPGAVWAESAAVTRLIDWARTRVGLEHISRTDLAGVSYGAYLVPIVFGNDCALSQPRIDGSATSMSPPVDLLASATRLDAAIAGLLDGQDEECVKTERSPLFLLEFTLARTDRGVADRYERCGRIPVVRGFIDWLREMIGTFARPDIAAQWERDPGYRRYMQLFAPEVAAGLGSNVAGDLVSRVQALPASCRDRVRVVSAIDDFLNTAASWSQATGPEFVLLPRGGHAGYLADEWFNDLRRKLYSNAEKSGTPTN
jgi:predicted alpha/beta-fold hydrolase